MKKEIKNPWSFASPEYDHRSSSFVNAGSHMGVGKKQPVGHSDAPKQHVPCLPMGKMKTLKDDTLG